MTASPVYQASPIRRTRATKAEVEARREALLDIIEAGRPMTVRQVFYQATVRGLVEKAEIGYSKVQTDLTIMRRAGELPYHWLADNTRWQRKPRTFNRVEQALREPPTSKSGSRRTRSPSHTAGCRFMVRAAQTHIGRLHAFNDDAHHHLMKDDSPRDKP